MEGIPMTSYDTCCTGNGIQCPNGKKSIFGEKINFFGKNHFFGKNQFFGKKSIFGGKIKIELFSGVFFPVILLLFLLNWGSRLGSFLKS
jgi:hypothetical protein